MIYADHAATTALSPTALEAMRPWLTEKFGNPSTLYSFARDPRKAVASARQVIAECIGAQPEEIYFTSGGTESDNWALTGTAFRRMNRQGKILTGSIEHHAVLHSCAFLERMGYSVDYLPVDDAGRVQPDVLESHITNDTMLVSVMLANNEIGTIQPIRELADEAHRHDVLFHTDAVQAVGHIPIDVNELKVDMLSASAHKFNGPKGIGFLYIRKGVSIEPFMHGGAQEHGMRAGTENVAGIVGMATALQEHQSHIAQEMDQVRKTANIFVTELKSLGLDFILNGSRKRIPGSVSVSFRDADGEMLMNRLDLMGTSVATGSACDSKNTVLSHVIQAIRVPEEYAHGTIRVTFGMENTGEEAKEIARQIQRILG